CGCPEKRSWSRPRCAAAPMPGSWRPCPRGLTGHVLELEGRDHPMLKLADARNFGRTFTGLLLIAGPLLMLVATAASPDVDNDDKTKELANVAAHKSMFVATGLLFLLGSLCILGGAIGLIHLFRGRRVGLGQLAGGLLVLGATVPVGFYTYGIL